MFVGEKLNESKHFLCAKYAVNKTTQIKVAMDGEVHLEVWKLKIPVQFTMCASDVASYERPQPQFVS